MSLPRVSVITVTYNAEEFLEETVRSVIAQDYPNLEYLIIDGASTDGTKRIVDRYRDQIDIFVSEPDEGIYDAMNKGIRLATGEWLNFMNAGDTFAGADTLSKLTQLLEDASLDIICGDRFLLKEGKKTLQKAKGIEEFWTKGSPCFHQSMLIRKRAIADRGYNLCYKLSADYEFMVRSVVEKKRFAFVDFPLSIFLEGGASKKQVIRSQVEAIKILLDYTDDMEIVRNNIFFQGLVRQNMPADKNSPPRTSRSTQPLPAGEKPERIHSVPSGKECKGKILVIDPIFRGSRLFYSWLAASRFAKRGYQVDIISRTHAVTSQYRELFDSLPHTLYDGITASEDFWFGILTRQNVREILDRIRYLEEKNQYDFIYFAGLNEHYPNLFEELLERPMEELKAKKMLFIEYDVRHLVKEKRFFEFNGLNSFAKSLKENLKSKRYSDRRKRVVFSFLKAYPRTLIGILDERIENEAFSKILNTDFNQHFFYLPDPGPEILVQNTPAVEGKTKILLVGLQNRRKGLDQLIKYLRRYGCDENVEFVLAGKLTDETEIYRDELKKFPCLRWKEGYFPEEEIQRFYARTDYVMLPYTPDFTASSGVLAYATAFGKPVIATEHGLVGYKVRHYGLGLTYRYNRISELHNLLSSLPRRESEVYAHLSENALAYAGRHSIEAHQNTIEKVLING